MTDTAQLAVALVAALVGIGAPVLAVLTAYFLASKKAVVDERLVYSTPITAYNLKLEGQVKELEGKLSVLDAQADRLIAQNATLLAQADRLIAQNTQLTTEVTRLEEAVGAVHDRFPEGTVR